jgi:SAM-dependent methyltransferase
MNSNLRHSLDGLEVSRVISQDDYMFATGEPGASEHYFSVGRSALRAINACLDARLAYPNSDTPIESILDFGCGYGRVCRFLRAAFPDASISVSDTYAASARFCAESFGCTDIEGALEPDRFDLIWVGSVFTHLSEDEVSALLFRLAAALRLNGVLVFTTHGRFSSARHLADPQAELYTPGRLQNDRIVAGYLNRGFGFVRHEGQAEGVSIISPAWIHQQLAASTGLLQVYFQERGWDYHQDVYALLRSPLLDQ